VSAATERILSVYDDLRRRQEGRKIGSPGRSPGATPV
jgi:hypothetical protein